MVNNKAVKVDALINPGDRIAFFPKEYPLFADWKDFRLTDWHGRQAGSGFAP